MTAFQLVPAAGLDAQVVAVARNRIDLALVRLDRLSSGAAVDTEDLVHEIRKRCKEVRGLAQLARPGLGSEFGRFDRSVRDAARALAGARDAQVVVATFERLLAAAPDIDASARDRIHRRLAERAAGGSGLASSQVGEARDRLVDARAGIDRWELPAGFDPLAAGLGATYGRGRRGMRRAAEAPTDRRFHEWRKAVKHLWYQVRLLESSAPSVLAPLAAELDRLAEALGLDHDLAVLVEHLADEPSGGEIVAAARSAQEELRRSARRLGASLYAEPRRRLVDRMTRYWRTTEALGPEPSTIGLGDGA